MKYFPKHSNCLIILCVAILVLSIALQLLPVIILISYEISREVRNRDKKLTFTVVFWIQNFTKMLRLSIVDAHSIPGMLHRMVMDDAADVSEVHAASIFRVATCTSEMSATLLTTI